MERDAGCARREACAARPSGTRARGATGVFLDYFYIDRYTKCERQGGSAARRGELSGSVRASRSSATDGVRFAHKSEAEFAKILDFYGISWEYEPRSFPLEWDARGRVLESFNPDFYLPDYDLFIELTTLKQSLVTKKNRKIRRLRELYPDVHLKIFYGRDYRQLLLKYGLRPTAAAR